MNEYTCQKCGQYGLNCKCYVTKPLALLRRALAWRSQ